MAPFSLTKTAMSRWWTDASNCFNSSTFHWKIVRYILFHLISVIIIIIVVINIICMMIMIRLGRLVVGSSEDSPLQWPSFNSHRSLFLMNQQWVMMMWQ